MSGLRADAFRVVFDRIIDDGYVMLVGSEPMQGVRRFHAALLQHLAHRHYPVLAKPPGPHLTLRYGSDGGGAEHVDAISWRVDDLLLIESVHGRGHVPRCRWPLRPPA